MSSRNRKRAHRIGKALESIGAYDGALDWDATITDALVDLRHLCQLKRVSFLDKFRISGDHFAAECHDDA